MLSLIPRERVPAMPVRRPDPPSVRYLAYVIWASLLIGVLVVAAIAAFLGPGIRANQWEPLPAALPITAALLNVVLLAGARFIPRAMKEETPILTKNVVTAAVSEAGALFAAVAWMLTGSSHAVAGMIMGLSGIALCYPNDSRWRAIGGVIEGDPPRNDRP
jgi:hypothetical protein